MAMLDYSCRYSSTVVITVVIVNSLQGKEIKVQEFYMRFKSW